jgi:hypothetical protein
MRNFLFSATISATVQLSPLFDLPQASNKIVKYIHTLYLKVYTLKLFVYMQKITKICPKSIKM